MKTQLRLSPADAGQPLDLDDFLSASAQEGWRYELVEGELAVSPMPGMPHEDLVYWFVEALRAYGRLWPTVLKRVMNPARVFLPVRAGRRASAVEADIGCYRVYPTGPLVRRDWRQASPFLVIEVLSEDTAEKDLERNRRLYLRVPSIIEYWLLDPRESPDRPSLTILRRSGRRWTERRIEAGGTVTTPALPGFALVLSPPE
ncbi:MAG: Uma2 family endonuclease [Gemmataceae bacterium]|nr:Uma2 family endonuclease [Gemmataceae bacterium]